MPWPPSTKAADLGAVQVALVMGRLGGASRLADTHLLIYACLESLVCTISFHVLHVTPQLTQSAAGAWLTS